MTETVDVEQMEYKPEAIEVSYSDYELGDGIELSILPADKQGQLKFEFVKVFGYARGWVREPFVIREEAWRRRISNTYRT